MSTLCFACGSTSVESPRPVEDFEYRTGYTASYATCKDCLTLFQVPMPSDEELSSFYPSDYHSQTAGGILSRIRHQMRLRRLGEWLRPGDLALDFGCGNGSFVDYAADRLPRCQFIGYEMALRNSVEERAGGRVTIVRGSFNHLLNNLPPCRLITMNHVIEHLPDPGNVLSMLHGSLSNGGILVGQTPGAGSWEHRLFKATWSGFHAPRHTVIFSRKGLERLLAASGYNEVRCHGAVNPASLAISLASWFRKSRAPIRRTGWPWLFWVGAASAFSPIDLFSSSPAIMDFQACKRDSHG